MTEIKVFGLNKLSFFFTVFFLFNKADCIYSTRDDQVRIIFLLKSFNTMNEHQFFQNICCLHPVPLDAISFKDGTHR